MACNFKIQGLYNYDPDLRMLNPTKTIRINFSSHLWVALSSMYGKILVLLMVAFCLTEVLDNKIRPLAFQVIFKNNKLS